MLSTDVGHLWVIGFYQHMRLSMKNIIVTETFVNLAGIFISVWPTKAFTHNFSKRPIDIKLQSVCTDYIPYLCNY